MNNLYIVTGIDTDTSEKFEYEESSLLKAMEIYNSLKNDTDINGLSVLEYNLIGKRDHMVSINN